MRPNENVAKDLAYQQMIYNKLLELDTRMANLYPYTDIYQDVLEGGTRARNHPLPGISMETYSPSTLAVGGNQDDFLNNLSKRKPIGLPNPRPQIQRPPLRMNSTNATIPLTAGGMNNRMEIVKKVMKEQGLTLGKASKFVKDNNLYQKMEGGKKVNRLKKAKRWTDYSIDTVNKGLDLAKKGKTIFGMGMDEMEGGKKVNRLKKAKRWTDYSIDTVNKGLDLAKKGKTIFGMGMDEMEGGKKVNRLKKAKRWTDYSIDTVNKGLDLAKKGKTIFGMGMEGGKRPPSKWILYVKKYASDNNISYKDALKQAGESYKNSK